MDRFEVFMEAMGEIDRDLYREHYEDLKMLETKYVSESSECHFSWLIRLHHCIG